MVALSPMETNVVRLVAKGLMDKEIANQLGVGAATVKNHLSHIRAKMEVETRVEVALIAVSLGLVEGYKIPYLDHRTKLILDRVRDVQKELASLEEELEGYLSSEGEG